ncbi:MAG: hypothetical protein HW421_3897 [Ignavibacteria bacterium]|nr:hypothetical protein [Ignavibacteria bacterium]
MSYNIIFHCEAKKELDELDGSIRIIVLKLLKKIAEKPELGEPLGSKAGMDLTGYRKIYANKKKIRIVYKIIENELIVYIIAIGTRDKEIVFDDTERRIKKKTLPKTSKKKKK